MKPLSYFSSIAAAFLLTLSLQSEPANSQTSMKYVTPAEPEAKPETSGINKKAIKSFGRDYATTAPVKWFDFGNMQEAYFVEDGKQNRVYYKPNGRWFRTLTSYDGSLLESDIKSLVTQNFRNYQITNVTEVREGIMLAYFINIDAPKEFKQLIVYEGEVWVHQQFKKQ